jgi:rubrerythrin
MHLREELMNKNSIIDGCIKVEKSSAYIYKNLMQKFPETEDFWKNLFDDEVEHLSFLRDVKSLGLTDEMEKVDLPPAMPIINKTIKMTENATEKIKTGSISLKNALKVTLKLEESIVETYTNKIIANLMSCENKLSYKKIIANEKKHINKIKKMINES